MDKLSLSCLAVAVAVIATPAAAQDEIYLEITSPGLRRVAVAAPPLMVLPGTPADVAHTFQQTLDGDLAAAAPIAVVDPKLYSLVEDDPRPEVLNQRWRSIGAQFLLTGTVVRGGGQLVVEARLVDLVSGEFAFAKRYRAGVSAAEVVAHTLANDLVQVFTGRPGPFLSKMAFISDRNDSANSSSGVSSRSVRMASPPMPTVNPSPYSLLTSRYFSSVRSSPRFKGVSLGSVTTYDSK